MRNQLPVRSTQFSSQMYKCAVALLCCAFSIEPLFAQEVDWPYNGADLYNTRFANIDQINPSNVSQLKPAWTFHTGVLPSAHPQLQMEMTPLVVKGVMYITTGIDDVFALSGRPVNIDLCLFKSGGPFIDTMHSSIKVGRIMISAPFNARPRTISG